MKINTLSELQKINNVNDKITFRLHQTCRTCLKTDQMTLRNIFENNESIDENDINIVEELLFMKLKVCNLIFILSKSFISI